MPGTVYKLFAGATDTDFRGLEMQWGHANDNGNPSTDYCLLLDTYRGTGLKSDAPRGSSPRISVISRPAGMPLPGAKCIRIQNLSADGVNPANNQTLSAAEIYWQNRKDTTYLASPGPSIDGGGGARLNTARPASIVKVAGGSNATGWGDGNLGDEHWWRQTIAFDAANQLQTSQFVVGHEIHARAPVSSPNHSLDANYDQFRVVTRGGAGGKFLTDATWAPLATNGPSYTNWARFDYFDENGHIDTVYGPPGGGTTPMYSIHDPGFPAITDPWSHFAASYLSSHCTALPNPAGGATDQRYTSRGHYTKATVAYDFIEHTRYSDRESNDPAERLPDGTIPVCSVPGFVERWMRKWTLVSGVATAGPWVNVTPRWYGSTAYSIIDLRASSSQRINAGHYFLWLIYRGNDVPTQTIYLGDIWHGDAACTAADLAGDGTDPALAGPTLGTSPSAPANTAVPTISGTAQQGQTLTATAGAWSGSPTSFAYQWLRGAIPVGTNSSTYLQDANDVGSAMHVVVTATNAAGSASASSASTAVVTGSGPTVPPPTASGLSALPDLVAPRVRSGNTSVGASFAGISPINWTTYTKFTVAADGTTDLLWLYLKDNGAAAGSQETMQLAIYADAAGVPAAQKLLSTVQTFTAPVTLGWYPWTVSPAVALTAGTYWFALSGGTTQSVVAIATSTVASAGAFVSSRFGDPAPAVTGSNTAYSCVVEGTPVPVNLSAPTLSGVPQQGQVLTATAGGWSGSPTSFVYQWKRGATNVGTNSPTYTPVAGDVGETNFRVTVTATNAGGSTPASSAATTITASGGNTTIPALGGGKVRYPASPTVGAIRASLAPADWTTYFATTVSGAMTVDSIWYWLTDGAQAAGLTQDVTLGIYSDNGATGPGNLLVTSQTRTFTAPVSGDWYQFTATGTLPAAGTYWIAETPAATQNVCVLGYTTSTGNGRYTQSRLPDPANFSLPTDNVFAAAVEGTAIASGGTRSAVARAINAAGRIVGGTKGAATGGGI